MTLFSQSVCPEPVLNEVQIKRPTERERQSKREKRKKESENRKKKINKENRRWNERMEIPEYSLTDDGEEDG